MPMFQTSAAFWLALLASATGVTAHDVLQIHGSGTTNPSKCFWAIMEDFMDQIRHPLLMTYRAVGSSTGIAEFVNGNAQRPAADFGSGDLPLPEDEYNGLAAAGVGVVQLPILLGAVSFFHNVDGVSELDLDACLLARIFSRDITSWSHGDIVARNPGLATSDLQISVVRRVAGSSSTSSITSYLRTACPDHWPADKVGTTIEWESDTLPCEGSGGVTECITSTRGAIGYLDAGHGIGEGLPEVALVNKAGTVQTSAQAAERDGIAAALTEAESTLPSSALDDWSSVSLLNQDGEFTWPIVLLTYVYVREDLSYMDDPEEQTLLKAFLRALYDDNYIGQCVTDHGFTLPPEEIKTFARNAIANINTTGEAVEWEFESSTRAIEGQGEFVISQKRRTHNEVERDVLMDAVADLQQRTAELELLLASSASGNFDFVTQVLLQGGLLLAALWAVRA